jgi:citrate lyase subunit beta/citryl-CoA lyase
VLFVPGTRADRFEKAFAAGADGVVLDVEDGVETSRKPDARRAIGEWIASSPRGGGARFVRINAPGSPWIEEDLAWIRTVAGAFDAAIVPKTERATDVERVATAIGARRVIPLLETARGILRAAAIAGADADIPAIFFGAEDLTAELGISRTVDGDELLFARSQVVLAAASIGADAIDAVFVGLEAPEELRRDAARARALGFRGKMAIHPGQVAAINEIFSPTADEIAAARRIVDADEAARAGGVGAFRLDHRMVDAPVVRRAQRVLAMADRIAGISSQRARA